MTTTMKNALVKEIAAIEDWLQFDNGEELTAFSSLDEAKVQIEGMKDGMEDFPAALCDPEVMLMCWNYVVEQKKAMLEKARIEKQDDEIAKMNPDCLRFRKTYEDGSSAFIDPEQLYRDLLKTGYDAEHRIIILDALMAYHRNYKNNK